MKARDLIKRKGELQESKTAILKQIKDMTEDLEWKDLQQFIQTGDAGQVNGHEIDKLQRKRKHLELLEGSLNLEISKLRKRERLSKLQKLMRKADELEEKRKGSLYQRYLRFQEKIKALEEESRKLKAEVLAIRNEAGEFNQSSKALVFRLPELKQTLIENYFVHPDELEAMVKQAYQDNEKCLKADADSSVEDRLVRGFQLVLDIDSGEILEKKETVCTTDVARRNENVMKEVSK